MNSGPPTGRSRLQSRQALKPLVCPMTTDDFSQIATKLVYPYVYIGPCVPRTDTYGREFMGLDLHEAGERTMKKIGAESSNIEKPGMIWCRRPKRM
jgi:hypothetical protein